MNIKDLENFYNIHTYKSFSFASNMLGVTQPTLSESIKRLEKEIGVSLFYRSKSGIKLTPQGEQVLQKAKNLLNIKNDILTLGDKSHSNSLIFKIGCHAIIGRYFLAPFLKELHKTYSNITIHLIHSHSRDIQNMIQSGQIDIGIVVNPIRNPDLIIKRVFYDKIAIWRPQSNKFKKDQFIADLGLSQVQHLLRSWKNAPSKHISSSDFQIIGELVETGLGYGILPERFVLQEKLKLKMVFPNNFFKDEISLVYRPEFGKNESERFLIDTFLKITTHYKDTKKTN